MSEGGRRRVAVIGSGVAGLLAARLLSTRHDVTLYEAAPRLGGHVHTHEVESGGRRLAVDSGFIVFNDRTYPRFSRLLDLLGVGRRPTEMSFGVRCDATGLEYSGRSLAGFFAQRRNLLRPGHWRILRDLRRFGREAPELLADPDEARTLGGYLAARGYSRDFVEHYLVPMGAAIWSARPAAMGAFPAATFVRFFSNHGLLDLRDRPQWYVVEGGSARYVERLAAPLAGSIRLGARVAAVRRLATRVELDVEGHVAPSCDDVVLAVHADQALALLVDADREERALLSAIPFQRNEAVLHTDTSVLPRSRRAWAAWNYRVPRAAGDPVSVTYDMNALQGLPGAERHLVTLNGTAPIDPGKVLARMRYEHPIFGVGAAAAQRALARRAGRRRTYVCGAWNGYGFHEDGVVSALAVARRFGVRDLEEALRPAPPPPARGDRPRPRVFSNDTNAAGTR